MSFGIKHSLQTHAITVVDRESRPTRRRDVHPVEPPAIDSAPICRIGTIVVPLDGTPYAEHALPLAMAIAKRAGGTLKLVRVFLPSPTPLRHRQWDAFDIMEDRLRIDALHYLDHIQKRISISTPELKTTTQLVSASKVVDGIVQGAEKADLVVMATRGRGWLGRLLLGSTSRDILRHREQPTIFVRGDATAIDLSADSTLSHVSIVLDGSDEHEQTFKMGGTLVRLSNARSSLIHTYDPRDPRAHSGNSSPGTYLDSHRRAFAKYVPDVQAYLAAEASNPTESLVSFINDFETDLLVTPVREAHAKEIRTTSSLIRKSRVPVLVVRESASLSHVT